MGKFTVCRKGLSSIWSLSSCEELRIGKSKRDWYFGNKWDNNALKWTTVRIQKLQISFTESELLTDERNCIKDKIKHSPHWVAAKHITEGNIFKGRGEDDEENVHINWTPQPVPLDKRGNPSAQASWAKTRKFLICLHLRYGCTKLQHQVNFTFKSCYSSFHQWRSSCQEMHILYGVDIVSWNSQKIVERRRHR